MSQSTESKDLLQSARIPFRQLWQVPTLVIGLAALIGVIVARPALQQLRTSGDAELSQARSILQSADGDPEEAQELIKRFLDSPDHSKKREGEAEYLMGKALAKFARGEASEDALELWLQSHEHLKEALRLGVPESDHAHLLYLLGVAGFFTKQDPHAVVDLLSQSIESADEKVEGYQILTQAYLRLPTPNLEEAFATNEKLRQLPLLGEQIMAPARLLGGELLLEMDQANRAREILSGVTPEAPPTIYARARTLQAQSYQREEKWSEAARIWDEILKSKTIKVSEQSAALFQLGICYHRQSQLNEALRTWQESIHQGESAAANASRLALCDAGLQQLGFGTVQLHLKAVVQGIQSSQDWNNEYIDLAQAQAIFEKSTQHFLQAQSFAESLELAQLYERIAEPGVSQILQAESQRLWAKSMRPTTPAQATKQAAMYRQAGENYQQVVQLIGDQESILNSLQLASRCYSQAKSHSKAITVLQQLLKQEKLQPKEIGEAFYLLGQNLASLGEEKEAEAAFTRGLSYPGKYTCRSRFELAQIETRRGNTGPAAEMLRVNIQQLRQEPDAIALENSLYALGRLLYQRKDTSDFKDALRYLKEALERFPNSDWGQRGRYQLAEALYYVGRQRQKGLSPDRGDPKSREAIEAEGRQLVKDAAQYYATVRQTLPKDRGAIEPITKEEEQRVYFQEADAYWWAGEYRTSLQRYEAVAEHFKGTPYHLRALGFSLRCYIGLLDREGFKKRAGEIRKLVAKNPDPNVGLRYASWIESMEKIFSNLSEKQ